MEMVETMLISIGIITGVISVIVLIGIIWLMIGLAKDMKRAEEVKRRLRESMPETLVRAKEKLKEIEEELKTAEGDKKRELEELRFKTLAFIAYLEANIGRV